MSPLSLYSQHQAIQLSEQYYLAASHDKHGTGSWMMSSRGLSSADSPTAGQRSSQRRCYSPSGVIHCSAEL